MYVYVCTQHHRRHTAHGGRRPDVRARLQSAVSTGAREHCSPKPHDPATRYNLGSDMYLCMHWPCGGKRQTSSWTT